MAEDSCCILSLVEAMDNLWFHQLLLFHQPTSIPSTKTTADTSPKCSIHTDTVSGSFEITSLIKEDKCNNEDLEKKSTPFLPERPTTLTTLTKLKTRSHSFSPFSETRPKKLYYSSSMGTLPESAASMFNFKTLWDLELEEVKGFIDLGFSFKKEQISQRLMSLVPGLQRLGAIKNMQNFNQEHDKVDDDIEGQEDHYDDVYDDSEEEKNRGIMRPYLSEAWLIKRPDSPLLNLRVPRRVSGPADMKKHLRFWARTVASEIQQES